MKSTYYLTLSSKSMNAFAAREASGYSSGNPRELALVTRDQAQT